MKILAMDIGKSKTVVCYYDSETGERKFSKVKTVPQQIHDLLTGYSPDRVVFEICSAAGWVHDVCSALKIETQVANPNTQAWRWKNVKNKNDKKDALKLAQLSAMNQLPMVHMPNPQVRQKRALIQYRQTLVARDVQIKNSIRAILDKQGHSMAAGKSGWTNKSIEQLSRMALPMDHQGRISGQGNKLLRVLLVEVSWLGLRYNPWLRETYQRLLRGSPSRKKIAITAVARKLLVRCWAMLRDGRSWRNEAAIRVA
jgi:transposase